jgi:hypothetical protein
MLSIVDLRVEKHLRITKRQGTTTNSNNYTSILVWIEPLWFSNGNTSDADEHKPKV